MVKTDLCCCCRYSHIQKNPMLKESPYQKSRFRKLNHQPCIYIDHRSTPTCLSTGDSLLSSQSLLYLLVIMARTTRTLLKIPNSTSSPTELHAQKDYEIQNTRCLRSLSFARSFLYYDRINQAQFDVILAQESASRLTPPPIHLPSKHSFDYCTSSYLSLFFSRVPRRRLKNALNFLLLNSTKNSIITLER
ncbi:hypothetical protein BD770DRAFT_392056 [Pilaira anomala]|nr:hypothetical protein BD770DRAFT_392056 [Pilaira anomala]